MYLRALFLRHFRLYEERYFEFGPGINIIKGANAQGKTSLLEAIHFLMTGRSFRTSQVTDLVREGASFFHLEACFVKHDIEQRLKITGNGRERKIVYNSTVYPSSSSLLGLLHGVTIHPDDTALVKGSPQIRRHFLDLQIAQVDPLYVHHFTRYNRAMRQRNSLLRAKNGTTIESWEYEMAHAAAYVIQQRFHAVEDLRKQGSELHRKLGSENEEFNLNYKTGASSPYELDVLRQYYLAQFQKHRKREMEFGMTISGPHRDDLSILLNNKEARFFASEGQQRGSAAALRMAEWERLKVLSLETPLMLIDDVGISLDSSRRKKLFAHLASLGQVFLTTTDECEIGGYQLALLP
jgi:DNA replication and repair protein RecF